MRLIATHNPDTKQTPADSFKDWEVNALCAWLRDFLVEDHVNALVAALPSVGAKLYGHPVNVYGEEL